MTIIYYIDKKHQNLKSAAEKNKKLYTKNY